MEQDVQGEGGLAHARPGGQEDELPPVKAGEGAVQVPEPCGHAGDVAVGHGQLLEAVKHVHQDLGQGFQPLGDPALADGIDPLLRQIQHGLAGLSPLLDQGGEFPGGLRNAAEEGLVLDDADILLHIGRGGGDLHELEQVVPGGVLIIDPPLLHLVQHRHRVNGGGEVEHGVDGLVNLPVGFQVEILRVQGLNDIGDAPGVNEHGAQNRLLGLHTVGDLAEQ